MLTKARRLWDSLGLATKFGLIYTIVLSLIIFTCVISSISLLVLQDAGRNILTSMEIRQKVFELDGRLEKTRRLYRDFILNYPRIGFSQAHERYALPAIAQMARLVAINEDLRRLLARPNVSSALRQRNVDINLYLSTVKRYTTIALRQFELFMRLANPETGLQQQLDNTLAAAQKIVAKTAEQDLLLREVHLFEKEYRLTQQRPFMQRALNIIDKLHETIQDSPAYTPKQRQALNILFADYTWIADQIVKADVAIRSNSNEFILQAKAMDPIAEGLKAITASEVEWARHKIRWASRMASAIILGTAMLGVFVAVALARLIHLTITTRIVQLTRQAAQVRADAPEAHPETVEGDELAVLGETFDAMIHRVEDLVDNLEEKVRVRTQELDRINQELDNKNQALEVLSQTDRLTGLCNRRKLDHTLGAEMRRARRYGTPFSVIMADIDHFKIINDRFGHQQGDAVLVQLADILTGLVRDTDIVGRWGGEEFLLVCPETSLAVAGDLAERLRQEIAHMPFPVPTSVTTSFGVAQYGGGDRLSDLVARVDAALYAAKQNGRNRVELSRDTPEPVDAC